MRDVQIHLPAVLVRRGEKELAENLLLLVNGPPPRPRMGSVPRLWMFERKDDDLRVGDDADERDRTAQYQVRLALLALDRLQNSGFMHQRTKGHFTPVSCVCVFKLKKKKKFFFFSCLFGTFVQKKWRDDAKAARALERRWRARRAAPLQSRHLLLDGFLVVAGHAQCLRVAQVVGAAVPQRAHVVDVEAGFQRNPAGCAHPPLARAHLALVQRGEGAASHLFVVFFLFFRE